MTKDKPSEGEFQLDSRLAGDCLFVNDLALSTLLILNDSRYPWLILVPRRANLRELHHLSGEDQLALWREISDISQLLDQKFSPTKMNIGALGNIVNQLHIHIVARNENDPAWPGPVWGHSQALPYTDKNAASLIEDIVGLIKRTV